MAGRPLWIAVTLSELSVVVAIARSRWHFAQLLAAFVVALSFLTIGIVAGGAAPAGVAPTHVATRATNAAEEGASSGESGASQTLFRADSRGPDEIFNNGFEPKGNNLDLAQHVSQNPSDSGFVSTSKSLQSAQDFGDESQVDYVYKLRATGIDVNETLGDASPFPWENEVAVPGSIPGSAIEGAWGPEGWLANAAFAG
jgi:hypothetical protein